MCGATRRGPSNPLGQAGGRRRLHWAVGPLGKVATEALAIRITVLVLTLIGNSASRVNTILIVACPGATENGRRQQQ
jgi:hypothetical protein